MPLFASPSTATPLPTTRPRSTSQTPPMNVLSHWIWNTTSQLLYSRSFQSSPKVQRIQVTSSVSESCMFLLLLFLSDCKMCHLSVSKLPSLAPVQCNNPGSSGRVVEHWHFLAWSCDSWSSSPTRGSGLLLFYLKTVDLSPRSSLSSCFGQSEQSHIICGDAACSTLGRRPLTPFPAARAL